MRSVGGVIELPGGNGAGRPTTALTIGGGVVSACPPRFVGLSLLFEPVAAGVAGAVTAALFARDALLGRSDDLTNRLDIWAAVLKLVTDRPALRWGYVSCLGPLGLVVFIALIVQSLSKPRLLLEKGLFLLSWVNVASRTSGRVLTGVGKPTRAAAGGSGTPCHAPYWGQGDSHRFSPRARSSPRCGESTLLGDARRCGDCHCFSGPRPSGLTPLCCATRSRWYAASATHGTPSSPPHSRSRSSAAS